MFDRSGMVAVALSLIAAGCIGPTENTLDEDEPVAFGDLRVVTVTSGPGIGPDSYRVRIDESLSASVEPNGQATFTGLPAREYSVVLDETGTCVAGEPNPRSISIIPGTVVETAFTVSCP